MSEVAFCVGMIAASCGFAWVWKDKPVALFLCGWFGYFWFHVGANVIRALAS